jgi:hypothetical protein
MPGAGGGGPLVHIVTSLFMVPLVWMFWVCLYPVTAVARVAAGIIVMRLLNPLLPSANDADVAKLAGVIAGFAAAVIVSRLEYRLAQRFPYRAARHVVRLSYSERSLFLGFRP